MAKRQTPIFVIAHVFAMIWFPPKIKFLYALFENKHSSMFHYMRRKPMGSVGVGEEPWRFHRLVL